MQDEVLKIWYLKKINILSGLSEKEMMTLGSQCRMKRYQNKEMIYLDDETSSMIYFLKKGSVRLSRISPEGKEITISVLSEGECFGSIYPESLTDTDVYAQSMSESTMVCFIPKDLFNQMIEMFPSISLKLSRYLGLKVKQMEIMLSDLTFKPVLERVISTLKRMSEKFGNDLPFTQLEISQMIGATREATSNALLQLKKSGKIELMRNIIQVINLN
jgi:CRP-like cAMP-binding protein